jgi:flagellar assembly protein FliH
MSSSKIIKHAYHDSTGVSAFNFRSIGQTDRTDTEGQSEGQFVPMGLFQGAGSMGGGQGGPGDAGPPVIEISADELNLRMNAAFNDGLKEGKELAERGLINVFRALRASSESIHNLRDKTFRESEDEIINLVMLVARKVIIQEITQDRSILAGIVQAAIADLSAREEITVRINPDDYQMVTTGRNLLLRDELLNDRLMLKPDPSVATGFCLVETEMGTIDASLESQLDQIHRSLLDQRTASAAEES